MNHSEIDRALAENVMGWRKHEDWWVENHVDHKREPNKEIERCLDCGYTLEAWSPSTNMSEAWRVVEKMVYLNYALWILSGRGGNMATFRKLETGKGKEADFSVSDVSPAMAISKAALKAVGVEI